MGKKADLISARKEGYDCVDAPIEQSEEWFTENIEEMEELENDEYNDETIFSIHKGLLKYVEENALPMCEYLSYNKLEMFISNLLN